MPTHNLHNGPSETAALHRIGSVSRLAGVPVSTLRMWEGRYGAFVPGKTEGRHRLYADSDVVRARLLRQLTECGHSIGGIAQLPAQQLQGMLVDARSAGVTGRNSNGARKLAVVVFGPALASRINSSQFSERLAGDVLDVRAVFGDFDEAFAASPSGTVAPDLLLARVNALQPAIVERLLALQGVLQARHGVLLYNFGAQATLAALREAGFTLRREPVDDGELAEVIRSFTWAHADAQPSQAPQAAIPARRYSDEQLAIVAGSPSGMLCECPRHISDIITQLSSFEDYSASCLNESIADAHVHARLRSVAGSARALFESALEMVLAHNAKSGAAGP